MEKKAKAEAKRQRRIKRKLDGDDSESSGAPIIDAEMDDDEFDDDV